MEKYLEDFDVEHQNPSVRALNRWRSATTIVKNRRRRFRMVANLAKRSEAEKRKLELQEKSRVALYVQKASRAFLDKEAEPLLGSSETQNTHRIDIEEDNSTASQVGHNRNNVVDTRKVTLEWIFVITNFILEFPSIVFDQLSSVHKPQYALVALLISIAAIIMCTVEFVYKARKEKVIWKWRGALPWLYYPSATHKPFGTFKDIIGQFCAFGQCIVTTINYIFLHHHADNPIKVSVWPVLFAFGLLCSKF